MISERSFDAGSANETFGTWGIVRPQKPDQKWGFPIFSRVWDAREFSEVVEGVGFTNNDLGCRRHRELIANLSEVRNRSKWGWPLKKYVDEKRADLDLVINLLRSMLPENQQDRISGPVRTATFWYQLQTRKTKSPHLF